MTNKKLSRAGDLAHQVEELRRVNAKLRQFVYAVSHDLNEPLRTEANVAEWLTLHCQGALDVTLLGE